MWFVLSTGLNSKPDDDMTGLVYYDFFLRTGYILNTGRQIMDYADADDALRCQARARRFSSRTFSGLRTSSKGLGSSPAAMASLRLICRVLIAFIGCPKPPDSKLPLSNLWFGYDQLDGRRS